MLKFFSLIFLCISTCAVLVLIGLGKHPSEAIRQVVRFWKSIFVDIFNELFGMKKTNFYYPLVFGTGQDGLIYPELVDSAFESLYKLFGEDNIFFYSVHYPCEDIISYIFSIYVDSEAENCIDVLKKRIKKRLEVMVNRRFKDCAIYNVLPEPFIYFEVDSEDNPTLLRVSFARTQKGVSLISEQKHRLSLEHLNKKRNSSFSLKSDWESDEKDD